MAGSVRFLDVYQVQEALVALWARDTGQPPPPEGPAPDEELRDGLRSILLTLNEDRRRNLLIDVIRYEVLGKLEGGGRRPLRAVASFVSWVEDGLGVKAP